MSQQQILHIPGLGNGKTSLPLFNRLNDSSRQVTHFDSRWESEESAQSKYRRLTALCAQLSDKGTVKLVGVSAGGSLTTQLLNDFPEIDSAHFISAKVRGSATIGPEYQARAPSLVECVKASEVALQNVSEFEAKSTVYRPLLEWVVPLEDMLVGNAERVRLPVAGHAVGIGAAILFSLPRRI